MEITEAENKPLDDFALLRESRPRNTMDNAVVLYPRIRPRNLSLLPPHCVARPLVLGTCQANQRLRSLLAVQPALCLLVHVRTTVTLPPCCAALPLLIGSCQVNQRSFCSPLTLVARPLLIGSYPANQLPLRSLLTFVARPLLVGSCQAN